MPTRIHRLCVGNRQQIRKLIEKLEIKKQRNELEIKLEIHFDSDGWIFTDFQAISRRFLGASVCERHLSRVI